MFGQQRVIKETTPEGAYYVGRWLALNLEPLEAGLIEHVEKHLWPVARAGYRQRLNKMEAKFRSNSNA